MRDDGVPAMQYKLLCTTQDWSPPKGLLVWRVDTSEKTMLPDGEPKGRFTLWTMKSSHGRLSDVIGR
jgi:hypothetical protein